MSILRKLALGLGLLPLIGSAPLLAQGATIEAVVAAARADVGKDIGGGITLIGVEADDARLRFGFRYVATAAQLEAIGRQAFEDGFVGGLSASLCSNPPVPPFMAAGGVIEVTMVDPDGATLIARRVTSC